ncbi:unnamed protein product, partial [Didymodactylos carnosus]
LIDTAQSITSPVPQKITVYRG